eukprot:CAMPEP_0197722116 /NCGR_PEP_ID=MMETSP1434-20131217/4922_1 /TAXON_ID=265543 /ORGANISM="Minutocellus polymorphus, Strain CCMP3303" /LENGTH=59 /DNA_ID=CAMNT_0043307221 /DNA_START=324 /DNA_END=500 /DNA_ORIENTATION=-
MKPSAFMSSTSITPPGLRHVAAARSSAMGSGTCTTRYLIHTASYWLGNLDAASSPLMAW